RHAAALYSEHFPTFLKISLLAYAPLVAFLALFYFLDDIVPMDRLTSCGAPLVFPAIFLFRLGASVFAYFACSAVTIPIVVQVMIAPLREVRVRTALPGLPRRWARLRAASRA